MSDRPFTLIDVQRGMWKLKLHSILNEEFKLFWGLIMTANDLGFKNPIELVNQDAMSLAKVNNREMLRRRRNALTKARVYGNWILKYTRGNGWQTQCGKYEINYEFLVSTIEVWNGDTTSLNGRLSTGVDRGVDRSVPRGVTQPLTEVLTTLRSDQKREDSSFSPISNIITNIDLQNPPQETKEKKVIEFEENRTGYVIMKGREVWGDWVPRVNTPSMDEAEEIGKFQKEAIDEAFSANSLAMKDTTAKRRPRRGSTRWILNRLQNPEKFGAPKILTEEQKQGKQEYEKAEQLLQEERERFRKEREVIEKAKASLSSKERSELKALAETEVKKMDGIENVGFILDTLIGVKENEILRKQLDEDQ